MARGRLHDHHAVYRIDELVLSMRVLLDARLRRIARGHADHRLCVRIDRGEPLLEAGTIRLRSPVRVSFARLRDPISRDRP